MQFLSFLLHVILNSRSIQNYKLGKIISMMNLSTFYLFVGAVFSCRQHWPLSWHTMLQMGQLACGNGEDSNPSRMKTVGSCLKLKGICSTPSDEHRKSVTSAVKVEVVQLPQLKETMTVCQFTQVLPNHCLVPSRAWPLKPLQENRRKCKNLYSIIVKKYLIKRIRIWGLLNKPF